MKKEEAIHGRRNNVEWSSEQAEDLLEDGLIYINHETGLLDLALGIRVTRLPRARVDAFNLFGVY